MSLHVCAYLHMIKICFHSETFQDILVFYVYKLNLNKEIKIEEIKMFVFYKHINDTNRFMQEPVNNSKKFGKCMDGYNYKVKIIQHWRFGFI